MTTTCQPNDAPEAEAEAETETPPPASPAPKGADVGFGEFWKAYPRKVGKDAALRRWKKLKPSKEVVAQMVAAIGVQMRSEQWRKDGGQFIPYPATWLHEGRWKDGETAVASNAAATTCRFCGQPATGAWCGKSHCSSETCKTKARGY